VKELVLLTSLIVAGEWDIFFYKVPNKLVIAALIIGFGLSPSLGFIVRFMFVILLGALAHRFGFIGAGDVKLYALICAFVGIIPFFKVFALSVLFAGGMAIIKIFVKKRIRGLCIPMGAAIAAGYALYLI